MLLYFRIEHQRLHEKHKGHEAMHAEMVLILIATLVIAQILLVQWKQRYFRSYQVRCVMFSFDFYIKIILFEISVLKNTHQLCKIHVWPILIKFCKVGF